MIAYSLRHDQHGWYMELTYRPHARAAEQRRAKTKADEARRRREEEEQQWAKVAEMNRERARAIAQEMAAEAEAKEEARILFCARPSAPYQCVLEDHDKSLSSPCFAVHIPLDREHAHRLPVLLPQPARLPSAPFNP